ncbi:glycoside hydrolase family 25 protein [Corynebacterium kroppenstedtii]|uniref:glycoside hydrolase family 25 protein n=1 Tax=Corynebacterium sp. PCR 32 TaxID=3351342 RepID=UPI0030A85986
MSDLRKPTATRSRSRLRSIMPGLNPFPATMKHRKLAGAALVTGSLLTTAALVSTAAGFTPADALNGIDVSSNNHVGGQAIDWNSVAGDNQSFAFIKATEGTDYTNPYFGSDSKKAKAAGLTIGSYHYARPGTDARQQARFYAHELANQPQPALPPTLDLEETGGLGPQQLQNWVSEWVDEVKKQTGRTPIMYTYYSFWINNMGNTTKFSDLPLWLAYYDDSLPDTIPGGWDHVTFWQHSGSGSVDGINAQVDLNKYDGTDAELKALANNMKEDTPVGGVATTVKPAVDADVASASVSNDIQHQLQTSPNPVLKSIGNSFNVPIPDSVLVATLGVAAGTVSLSQLWDTIREEGFGGQLADQLVRAVTEVSQNGAVLRDQLQGLLGTNSGATLGQLEKALSDAVSAIGDSGNSYGAGPKNEAPGAAPGTATPTPAPQGPTNPPQLDQGQQVQSVPGSES